MTWLAAIISSATPMKACMPLVWAEVMQHPPPGREQPGRVKRLNQPIAPARGAYVPGTALLPMVTSTRNSR